MLLRIAAGSASPSQAQANTVFPPFWRIAPRSMNGGVGCSPVSSTNSLRAVWRRGHPYEEEIRTLAAELALRAAAP